jgi:hypothetical protein
MAVPALIDADREHRRSERSTTSIVGWDPPRRFQVSSRFPFEFHGWKKRGTTPIEDLVWQKSIPVESDGKVLLSKDSILRLGIANSREYQFQYENVYLAALSLTLARFQFMIQGFSNSGIFYSPLAGGGVVASSPSSSVGTQTNTPPSSTGTSSSTGGATTALAKSKPKPSAGSPNNQLQLSTLNGFSLNLMSGAQLLVNLANSLVFEYSNHGLQLVSPSLTINFIQPLLVPGRGGHQQLLPRSAVCSHPPQLFSPQFYVGLVASNGH